MFLSGCGGGIVTPVTDTDEAVVQEVLSIHDLAEQKLDDIAEDPNINNIEDILNNLSHYLEEQEGVDSVVLNDNSLQINYESGIVSSIVLHDTSTEPFLGDIGQNFTSSILFNKQARKEEKLVSKSVISDFKLRADENIEYLHNHNILIWAPMESIASNNILGYGNYGIISGLEERFAESNLNFTVNSLADEDADINSLQTITDYGMVFLFSHGADSGWLETGEVVKDSNAYKTEIENKSIAITQHYWIEIAAPSGSNLPNLTLIKKGKPIYSVNVNWFNNHLSNKIFPNTIIVNLSCESFNLPLYLCNTFIGHNAGAYYGFEGRVGAKFVQQRAYELAENIRDGDKTTGEAYKPSTDWFYGGAWKMTGKENLKFSKDTVSNIVVLPETMSLVEGDSQTIESITAHYNNGNTINVALNACTYDSSNTGVATVDTGVIMAVAPGSATITVGYTEGDITKFDTVVVTVTSVTLETYTITASAGPHGSISPSGNVTVNQGSDKSFTITPVIGYSIDDVLVDGSSVGAVSSYTFTNVTEDHTIYATFISEAFGSVHNLTKGTYYNTIQAALDDADNDNTIEVSDGTYDETITFPFIKKIILRSINGASSTIIRGNDDSATVISDSPREGTTLEGFTLTHANGDKGRGIYTNGNLTIKNCIISSNSLSHLTDDGGGIYNYHGTITIIGTTISGNTAGDRFNDGGGIGNDYGSITIIGSTISGNTAGESSGAIYNYKGSITITGSTISDNTSDRNGGGIYSYYGSLTITGSTISGNSADYGNGGGIENYCGSLTITGSTISGNSADYSNGGGIYNYKGSITITGSTISSNSTNGNGGGIYLYSSSDITIGGSSDAEKNTICGNYKIGEVLSLGQQIMDNSGSLYETYKGTNYISVYCD